MSREIRRVPLDFAHPLKEVWPGYLLPEALREAPCEPCGQTGYSPFAKRLYDRWYGRVPFDPAETGSEPFTPETPGVRRFAERNVARDPLFYATFNPGPGGVVDREARRLCGLWNGMWSHHLAQEDVDALIDAGRLTSFTHHWADGEWKPIEPKPVVTARQVNLWSLTGIGHGSINAWIVVDAACTRAGEEKRCSHCGGHGSREKYEGQRAEAEAWKPTEPPTGEGYQLWETISEGSPVSPVFATPAELATWIKTHGSEFDGRNTPYDQLVAWIESVGVSIGTAATVPGRGLVNGVELAAERVARPQADEAN